MKKLITFILLLVFVPCAYGQEVSMPDAEPSCYALSSTTLITNPKPQISISKARQIRDNDLFLALVPGAVQMRRKWPAVAGSIWGGMAVTGGLAIYEQFHIVKLRNSMDGDPSNADWYYHKINKAKKVRNGSLIALGGIYVANYVTALLLPDRSPNRGSVALYADPQGAIGLTYALKF